MIVHRRGPDGLPREVELTEAEALVKEVHENLMDRGVDQGTALLMIEGRDLPTFTEDASPLLAAALADPEFRLYLAM
jgi:hypothetical protein